MSIPIYTTKRQGSETQTIVISSAILLRNLLMICPFLEGTLFVTMCDIFGAIELTQSAFAS